MFAIPFGVCAVICSFFLIQQKKHDRMLILKLICDVLWIVYLALIGAYSGMAISVIGAARELTFFGIRKQRNRCDWLLILFICAEIIAVGITWESAWSVCSLISGVLSTTAFYQQNTGKSKVILALVCISQFIYACHHRSVFALINECMTAVSLCLAWIRHKRKKTSEKECSDFTEAPNH